MFFTSLADASVCLVAWHAEWLTMHHSTGTPLSWLWRSCGGIRFKGALKANVMFKMGRLVCGNLSLSCIDDLIAKKVAADRVSLCHLELLTKIRRIHRDMHISLKILQVIALSAALF